MTRRKRLTPSVEGQMLIASDPAEHLAWRCSKIETALQKCGATAGVDYTYRDLMQWALEIEEETATSRALQSVASALRDLGLANAATPMGALEVVSMEIKNGFERLARAIEEAA